MIECVPCVTVCLCARMWLYAHAWTHQCNCVLALLAVCVTLCDDAMCARDSSLCVYVCV